MSKNPNVIFSFSLCDFQNGESKFWCVRIGNLLTCCPERTIITKKHTGDHAAVCTEILTNIRNAILDSTTWKTNKEKSVLITLHKTTTSFKQHKYFPHSLKNFDTSVRKILRTGVAATVVFSEEFTLFHILIILPGLWEFKKKSVFFNQSLNWHYHISFEK